jgi:hypothetical protein
MIALRFSALATVILLVGCSHRVPTAIPCRWNEDFIIEPTSGIFR